MNWDESSQVKEKMEKSGSWQKTMTNGNGNSSWNGKDSQQQ